MASLSLEEFSIPRCQELGLKEYLLWAKGQPVREKQEYGEYARQAASGERGAYGELIRGGVRMVLSLAKMYQGRGPSFVALIDEGNEGLCQAVESYVARGDYALSFMSYISWLIRERMKRAIVGSLQAWQDEYSALIEAVAPIGGAEAQAAMLLQIKAEEQDVIDAMVHHFQPYIPAVVAVICEEEAAEAVVPQLVSLAEEALVQAVLTYRPEIFEEQGWSLPLRTHLCLCLYRTLRNFAKKHGVEAPESRPDKDPKAPRDGGEPI